MNVPRMPGHTCPMIDKLKYRIESAFDMADAANSDDAPELMEVLRNIQHELQGEADALETLRDANLSLRNCAEYWERRADEAINDHA